MDDLSEDFLAEDPLYRLDNEMEEHLTTVMNRPYHGRQLRRVLLDKPPSRPARPQVVGEWLFRVCSIVCGVMVVASAMEGNVVSALMGSLLMSVCMWVVFEFRARNE